MLASFPTVYLGIKLKSGSIVEPRQSQVSIQTTKICLHSCSAKYHLTLTIPPLPFQPCDSQARVAVAISGSYFLFHLLYFLLLTIRLAQTAGKDAERWNLLLGENNSHLNVVTAFISHHWHLIVIDLPTGLSVWLIARPMFALVGLGWHLLTPAACCLLDQRLRREWPARYSLHILLWN